LVHKAAEAAGLVVQDRRLERLRTVFNDISAVVYFLRLVVWIVRFQGRQLRDRLLAHTQKSNGTGGSPPTRAATSLKPSSPPDPLEGALYR
jgi:hypothetical protein